MFLGSCLGPSLSLSCRAGSPKPVLYEVGRFLRADFREGDEESNFSVFRVLRFFEWPRPSR